MLITNIGTVSHMLLYGCPFFSFSSFDNKFDIKLAKCYWYNESSQDQLYIYDQFRLSRQYTTIQYSFWCPLSYSKLKNKKNENDFGYITLENCSQMAGFLTGSYEEVNVNKSPTLATRRAIILFSWKCFGSLSL